MSLTMVKPGSERGKGEPGGAGAGERGRPRRQQREGAERAGAGAGPGVGRPNGRSGGRGPGQVQQPAQAPTNVLEGAGSPGEAPTQNRPAEARPPLHGGRHAQTSGGAPSRGPRPPMPPRPAGPGGPSRGPGPRPPQHAQGGGAKGRFDRAAAPRPPQQRKSKPSAPLPPLSQDALAGNVPLRTFGQLKQLWQARSDDSPLENEQSSGPPSGAESRSVEAVHAVGEVSSAPVGEAPTDFAPSSAPDQTSSPNCARLDRSTRSPGFRSGSKREFRVIGNHCSHGDGRAFLRIGPFARTCGRRSRLLTFVPSSPLIEKTPNGAMRPNSTNSVSDGPPAKSSCWIVAEALVFRVFFWCFGSNSA